MNTPLHLFEGLGLELEYMIVDAKTLEVLPVADQVLIDSQGQPVGEMVVGPLRWSNELALHVLELKSDGPVAGPEQLIPALQQGVQAVNGRLAELGACLLPGAMHPWFDPSGGVRLWPHGNREIYAAYDRIFDCRGHGWANLQSTHLNLPFSGDAEFGRLHAAIRLVLPLLPALAASSPIFAGKIGPALDNRLQLYRGNQKRLPRIAGQIVPEAVFTEADYRRRILAPMFQDIAPLDPAGLLQEEWLNSRGAIARFDRSTIEIRLLDVQECPSADLAIVSLIIAALKALVEERWAELPEQTQWSESTLASLLSRVVIKGERVVIEDDDYLGLFGFPDIQATCGELWEHLAETLLPGELPEPLQLIFEHGPLARRLLTSLGQQPDQAQLLETYLRLAESLAKDELFIP
jgi:glutamate---cysteine ligase / carboxylate-amine ligase